MHELEKKMIDLGIIDNYLDNIKVGDWFDEITISFTGNNDMGTVTLEFVNCFEVSLKHDRTYSKGRRTNGELDYKYFIQDVTVKEKEGFFEFKISGWPLDGEIVCKDIKIHMAR